jgi:hypothetical protein
MSFQFPEQRVPPSTSPSGNSYPALLVMRETADIPAGLAPSDRERLARRVTRAVLDNFWDDIGHCSSAPFLQLMNRGEYNARAEGNRARIACDLARDAASRASQVSGA